jgi:hypothetical protein
VFIMGIVSSSTLFIALGTRLMPELRRPLVTIGKTENREPVLQPLAGRAVALATVVGQRLAGEAAFEDLLDLIPRPHTVGRFLPDRVFVPVFQSPGEATESDRLSG